MKRIISLLLLFALSINFTGCFKSDTMEDITIYTTIYPVEYINEKL